MCCIFTCCGWMIDLIQRLWTFTMSCCISSAVCCALLTGAMSGIALGYNYSLAEYIDLKETNVSVYLKRGIFDDEIGDDMEWRRSGHQPVAGHIGEHNLRTGEPEDESSTIRSGRRLDDSILESDDRHRFEGSLMKLTAKPPAPTPVTEVETTIDTDKILSKYSMGSLDQMKALQSLINMKKAVDPRRGRLKAKEETKPSQYASDDKTPQGIINPSKLGPGRKYMEMPPIPGMKTLPPNSARYAVPQEPLNEMAKWRLPKLPPEVFTRDEVLGDYDVRPTYPMPVTPRAGPVRPTRRKSTKPKPKLTTAPTPLIGRPEPNYPKSIDEDIDTFKDKLLFEAPPSFKDEDFMKEKDFMKHPKQEDDDYGDAVRGVPMRKKRHSIILDTFKNTETNKTSADNTSTHNLELQTRKDSVVFETLKNVEINKSSTHDPLLHNPTHLDANSNNFMNILRKPVADILHKEINGEILSTSGKLQVTISPEDAISIMSSSIVS